ncbi:MAG TPA: exodeoxyribonuclease III [Chryseolinea sp.]|nr:exodeoxyribonuclease III [Chryseolinea sp.]HPM32684.1 exodeoxyribonuclease III [Chryseolinea sp.]
MSALHLVNWNVNGIRAIIKKEFLENVKMMNPDVICLQETKAAVEEVRKSLEPLSSEYKIYINSSKARKGYSGTAIISRTEPLDVTYDMGIEEHDQEGRVITAEYPSYFLVTVYTPNSGSELGRLDYREGWDREFNEYLRLLARRKPVVLCGDLNVAHQPIDLARPKENYNKSSGYTQREIDGFTRLLESGFVDTFRHFYPQEVKYSYWNYVFNARANNAGWRIDYFLVSNPLIGKVKDAMIYNQYFGSDHCPVAISLDV